MSSAIHLPGLINPHDLSTDRQFSMNLARGMEVLRAFTLAEPMLGNREIADRTKLPKATVSRLTYTLSLLGYLSRVEGVQKYQLGSGVLSLGYPLLVNMRVRQVARPFMDKVAKHTGCNVNLGIRDRTNVVYVETSRADEANVYQPDIGSTRPLLVSAIGRALIAAYSAQEREAILNRLKVEDPERFQNDRVLWESDHHAFAERGYCISCGDWRKDIHAIAAPIRQAPGGEPLALNCTMSKFRLGGQTLEQIAAAQLLDAVQQIEMACGL